MMLRPVLGQAEMSLCITPGFTDVIANPQPTKEKLHKTSAEATALAHLETHGEEETARRL